VCKKTGSFEKHKKGQHLATFSLRKLNNNKRFETEHIQIFTFSYDLFLLFSSVILFRGTKLCIGVSLKVFFD
jgi:hypothetical protein